MLADRQIFRRDVVAEQNSLVFFKLALSFARWIERDSDGLGLIFHGTRWTASGSLPFLSGKGELRTSIHLARGGS